MSQPITIDDDKVQAHLALLRERVFQTETKWPHFNLLLSDVVRLADELDEGATVVSLERGLLYGGYSLLAPLFHRQNVIAVDCSPESAEERGAYNRGTVDDPRFVAVPIERRADIRETALPAEAADLVLVPNLVHHVAAQDELFAETARIARPGGRVYVFEPLVRELHQIPDDFLRYTPYGLADVFRRAGLQPGEPRMEGGPFSAVAYCWAQALEYFPADEREAMTRWFYEQEFPRLMAFDARYPENQVRNFTRFPMSFSLEGTKQ